MIEGWDINDTGKVHFFRKKGKRWWDDYAAKEEYKYNFQSLCGRENFTIPVNYYKNHPELKKDFVKQIKKRVKPCCRCLHILCQENNLI